MVTALRVLRVLFGILGLWQLIGLFPVLTWLTNPKAVTLSMVAVVVFKVIAAAVCGGMYYWLGRIKRKQKDQSHQTSDARIVWYTLLGVLVIAVLLGVSIATFTTSNRKGPNNSQTMDSAKIPAAMPSEASSPTQYKQPQAQSLQPDSKPEILPYERRAWSGNIFDQFDSVQVIEAKARSVPQLNEQRAWAAVIAWQAYFMGSGSRGANVALYMGVDRVLEGLKSNNGICRPGRTTTVDAAHASPEISAGSQVAWDDCEKVP